MTIVIFQAWVFADICRMFSRYHSSVLLLLILSSAVARVNAQSSPAWVAPEAAGKMRNPLTGSSAPLRDAAAIYSRRCAPCHGYQGRGDGPASVVLNPKPADHTSSFVQAQTDGALYWKLSTGRGQMLAYSAILTDSQRWGLVNYIRTLKHTETSSAK